MPITGYRWPFDIVSSVFKRFASGSDALIDLKVIRAKECKFGVEWLAIRGVVQVRRLELCANRSI